MSAAHSPNDCQLNQPFTFMYLHARSIKLEISCASDSLYMFFLLLLFPPFCLTEHGREIVFHELVIHCPPFLPEKFQQLFILLIGTISLHKTRLKSEHH
jgi:hypothetical protein